MNTRLDSLSTQRKRWIKFSFLFFVAIVFFLAEWSDIVLMKNKFIKGGILSFFAVISICWWYWTMNLINDLLTSRKQEINILEEIFKDLKSIKEEVKNLQK